MTITLKPDDNGIIVTLKDVSEDDAKALEKADKAGFNPTEAPFDKYYAYNKMIGFYVDKDHFDHAEHKGKRLSFNEYLDIMSDGKFAKDCIHFAHDAKYDAPFIVKQILEIKEPKNVNDANAALATLNFALFKIVESLNDATDTQKKDYHEAMHHALDVYMKATKILLDSNFDALYDLNSQLARFRNISANAQSALLQKYHENF